MRGSSDQSYLKSYTFLKSGVLPGGVRLTGNQIMVLFAYSLREERERHIERKRERDRKRPVHLAAMM